MSDIANLYDEVMAGAMEKVAEETEGQDIAFDADFFEKVAAGDDEAINELNEFVEAAKAEGASDEEIEEALGEAMEASGYDEEGDEVHGDEPVDEFEEAKLSAYIEGTEQAVADALESELAKEAGVTVEDLIEYELGGHYGTGYAEARQEADEAIMKIASKKTEGVSKARELLGKIRSKAGGAAGRYGELMAGGKYRGFKSGKQTGKKMKGAMRAEAAKVWGARGATGAGAAGLGYGGYRLARRKKD